MNIMAPICMTCTTKNTVSNDIFRSRQLLTQLQSRTRCATQEQKIAAQKKLNQFPYLRQMCHHTAKCKYGIHCHELNLSTLNSINQKVCEELVLLSCIDKTQLKAFVPRFRGDYPKAAAYISRTAI